MTYVVTESCIKCKYTDCVDVCPVDCFREGPNMLVLDPAECTIARCAFGARSRRSTPRTTCPTRSRNYHAQRRAGEDLKPIIERKPAPPDADEWTGVKQKKHLLEK